MSQTSIQDLPEEMMIRIFHLLPPQDLKKVMLVCKHWMEMGENPNLWTWSMVAVDSREEIQKLNICRLQLIQEIKVKECSHWPNHVECYWKAAELIELFEVILKIPTVNRIHGLSCTSLSAIEPNMLASVFSRLEVLELWIHLTPEQTEHLFIAIAGNSNLKRLEVSDASKVSPALFASAISNVDDVILCDGNITSQQMEELCVVITEEERPLRKLELISCNTHTIEPEVFGTALNRLEEVTTGNTWVLTEQMTAIIRKLVCGESKLKNLMLGGMDYDELAGLDQDLVRRARQKIGEFYFEDYTGPEYDTGSDNDTGSEYGTGPEYEEVLDDEYEEELSRLMYIGISE